ncbi:protein HOTHEAD [Ricinus communis]|uniref:Glucose-methanol-choline (Gmc) oxidoreductase, putative n=1 Tax=Ricinus communis TaxID=3988 RepID=B9R9I5_RICCO|nr:protein HOTHEAD [Ricinus communis]EEF51462.1 glucose-methanol-choline (gmc) oxidoreductase, putative [Ricinus communis]|eukprot:XP_002510860.1 protein HOTHEAD [Ricinus communis]
MVVPAWKYIGIVLAWTFMLHGISYSEKAPSYTFVNKATSAPRILQYDYIIIGGGTSGCPLAATLSKHAKVLVLERGGSPYGNPNITDIGNFVASLSDTSPYSPSQQFISEDGVYNTRARVLGGGSALNAGFFTRASVDYVKQAGWKEKLVNSSYAWVEKKVAFRPQMLQWQSAVRDGLIEAGLLPDNGFTYDHVHGTKVGGSIFDRDGHRHTAADLLEYADPRNITVYLHATVVKILFTQRGRPWPRPRAYGVVFEDILGFRHTAFLNRNAKNEIILSAGALGSPQLLMLSGIGPGYHLRAHGIPIVLDQPMVGEGMADNPMNLIFIPSPLPVEVSLIQVAGITRFGSYIESASGLTYAYAWARRFIREYEQSSNQTGEPNMLTPAAMAKAVETVNSLVNATLRGGVILEKVMGPLSTGDLKLRTTNPNDNPSVKFNYFKEPEDLRTCVEGMKTIIDVINSNAFSKFRYRHVPVQALISLMANLPVNLRPRHVTTAISLERFCVDTVMTIWHYHGGCQVGKVVDRDYRVIGVDGIRVIDGSTFLRSPGTNPQATVMMLGRYMGKRILRARLADRRSR